MMTSVYVLAAGIALGLSIGPSAAAYRGGLEVGDAGAPPVMAFEAAQTHNATAEPPAAASPDPSLPATRRQVAAKVPNDPFQRYFERHYRAHLVQDGSAHHIFDVE